MLQERACDVALRFTRLQKRWGPWGLAWWEALLRAADQQASRVNDQVSVAKTEAGSGSSVRPS
jgi:CRISPR-associated endonuclease/helicase Cas3